LELALCIQRRYSNSIGTMFSRLPQMETVPDQLGLKRAASGWGSGATGGARTVLIHVALIAVFGVFLPWQKGLDFVDPVMTTAYACLSVLFAAPAAAEAFAAARAGSLKTVLTRILVAVAYGECMALAMLAAGVITVSLTHGRLLVPVLNILAKGSALGVSASLALASVAAWITLRFSAGVARAAMRAIFLLLLAAFFFWSRWLPDMAGTGALIGLVVSAVAALALRRLGGRTAGE
jgi:hypothetical protein